MGHFLVGSNYLQQHSGFNAQPCISKGVFSLWIVIDPGFKWRLGTIDPLGFIMVCIAQDSERCCNPPAVPLPAFSQDHLVSSQHHPMALPKGSHTPGGALRDPGLAEGPWVLHPKHAQSSCPQPPLQQQGLPASLCPTPRQKNIPKTHPQEVLSLSGCQLGLFW